MDYDALWVTLWVTSVVLTVIYLGLAGRVYFRFRKMLDPFQRVAIITYSVAFVAKTIFWIISWQCADYNERIYNDTKKQLIPVQSTLGALVSGISFIILQIIIFRIFVEYD